MAAVQDSLILRLSELEILCHHPFLFQSEELFAAIFQLRGKLSYFKGLLEEDLQEAIRYWQTEVVDDLKGMAIRLNQKINLFSISSY